MNQTFTCDLINSFPSWYDLHGRPDIEYKKDTIIFHRRTQLFVSLKALNTEPNTSRPTKVMKERGEEDCYPNQNSNPRPLDSDAIVLTSQPRLLLIDRTYRFQRPRTFFCRPEARARRARHLWRRCCRKTSPSSRLCWGRPVWAAPSCRVWPPHCPLQDKHPGVIPADRHSSRPRLLFIKQVMSCYHWVFYT